MTYATKRLIAGFLYLPTLIFAFGTAMVVLSGGTWKGVFQSFATATVLRLIAGAFMNRMGHSSMIAEWNDRYHRFVVIVLNAGVGFVLLGRLGWDAFRHHGPNDSFGFLATIFVGYLVAAKFTRPNTLGARVRSMMLTVALITTMAYLAWPGQWGLVILGAVLAMIVAALRLFELQRRFGWADR